MHNYVEILIAVGILGGLGKTVQSMIWGFQFLFGTLFAMLVKGILQKLRKTGAVKREYVNNFMMNRISGFMFDIMVIASIAAIDLSAFLTPSFIIPLTIICILGAAASYLYLRVICRRVFPKYEDEAFLSLYGMLTGTASTGAILLREVDPKFETQASDNLVYHQPWAILFGFPMFLLLGVAPQSMGKCLLTLGVCIALFTAMNIILMRKSLFKKKK
jgi:ESS family glutamate:Na+ symporter